MTKASNSEATPGFLVVTLVSNERSYACGFPITTYKDGSTFQDKLKPGFRLALLAYDHEPEGESFGYCAVYPAEGEKKDCTAGSFFRIAEVREVGGKLVVSRVGPTVRFKYGSQF